MTETQIDYKGADTETVRELSRLSDSFCEFLTAEGYSKEKGYSLEYPPFTRWAFILRVVPKDKKVESKLDKVVRAFSHRLFLELPIQTEFSYSQTEGPTPAMVVYCFPR